MSIYTRTGTLERTIEHDVEAYIPLVRRLAHYLLARLPPSVQIEDLIQAGMIGLLDAMSRFEEGMGAQFETYATQRIRGAMLDELRKSDWMPRSVRQTQRKIDEGMKRAEQQHGRAPSETEIAEAMEIDLSTYQSMLSDARGAQLLYFDDMDSNEESADYFERHLGDAEADPEVKLSEQRFREGVVEGIGRLPEREKLVMALYYEQDLNFKEIAAVLEVTESRISQLHSQAISRLRTRMKAWR